MNLKALTNLILIGTGILLMVGVVMLSFTMKPMAQEAQVQALMQNAKEALEEGNFAAAMRNLSVAVKAYPNRSDIRRAMADAYLMNGQPLQAMAELKKAVELAPANYDANETYGEALEDLASPEEAIAFYSEMINKFPGQIEPRARAAGVHEDIGQSKQAEKIWEEAARAESIDDTAFIRWGQLLAADGDLPGALKVFQKGLSRIQDSGNLHFNMAAVLSLMGKRQEALAELKKAAKIDPELAKLIEQLGLSKTTAVPPMHVVSLRENADGALYVPSKLDNSAMARMVVDANVPTTLISAQLAKKLHYDTVKFPPVNYRTAARPAYKPCITVKSVKVATATTQNVQAGIYNPSAEERGVPRDGVLGLTYLKRYKYAVDTNTKQLVLVQ